MEKLDDTSKAKVKYLKANCSEFTLSSREDANGNPVYEVGYASPRARRSVSSTNLSDLLDEIIKEVESASGKKFQLILDGEIVG